MISKLFERVYDQNDEKMRLKLIMRVKQWLQTMDQRDVIERLTNSMFALNKWEASKLVNDALNYKPLHEAKLPPKPKFSAALPKSEAGKAELFLERIVKGIKKGITDDTLINFQAAYEGVKLSPAQRRVIDKIEAELQSEAPDVAWIEHCWRQWV
jgi:hypothetical protein